MASGSQEGAESGPRAGTGTGEELKEERAQQLGDPFTYAQEEQIAQFFKKYKCYYDLADADYKNKKTLEHLLLEFAQSMFTSGKCIFSFKHLS